MGKSVRYINKVKWKLKHNVGQLNIYVISLAYGNDLFSIHHCAYLKQKIYHKHPLFVIGIANGYDEAIKLVQKIVEDIYEKTGEYKIKDYLKHQAGYSYKEDIYHLL